MKEILKSRYGITEPVLLDELTLAGRVEIFSRGSMIMESGKEQRILPILLEGIVRGYLLDADGKDITDCFAYQKGDIIFGCNEIRMPSQINLEAITTVKCFMIPMSVILELFDRYPKFLEVYNQLLITALDKHWEIKMLMYRCTAMERYEWFLRHYGKIVDMVSNRHIASFLSMTPVTLSRLRRQIREANACEDK